MTVKPRNGGTGQRFCLGVGLTQVRTRISGSILDGITLRRTASGRLALSFPSRTAGDGRRHPLVRPVDDAARQAIERERLGQLGQHPDVAREATP